jgi:phage terminase small subunit
VPGVIEELGYYATGSRGTQIRAPWVRDERESVLTYNRLAEQFGLTPKSRTRLGMMELHRQSHAAEIEAALGAPEIEWDVDGIATDVPDAA